MAAAPPYLTAVGSLDTGLERIRKAATPDRFTRDFLHTKLKMKGGSANALIPFFKKIGLLAGDGTPTELYDRFRNSATCGAAIADAMRKGYEALFEVNEYAHELSDKELKGLVLQVTGLEEDNRQFKAIVSTFKRLKKHADFEAAEEYFEPEGKGEVSEPKVLRLEPRAGMNLSYTINLNLPPTTNIEVFHAIFKSLRQHLLDS